MRCCYLLFLLRAHCKTSQCYSAHSTCYSVLAVLELFYVFSKVSDFMLILMNIKNKLKCENNYLIRDQKQFNFYCRDSRARALCPQTRRQAAKTAPWPVPPSSGSQPAHISYSGGEISLKYFTFFLFFLPMFNFPGVENNTPTPCRKLFLSWPRFFQRVSTETGFYLCPFRVTILVKQTTNIRKLNGTQKFPVQSTK